MPRDADVVHEHLEPAERIRRFGDEPLGLARSRKVGDDVRDLTDSRSATPSAGDDTRALGRQLTNDLQPDPSGRAGDEASLAAEFEIHGRG